MTPDEIKYFLKYIGKIYWTEIKTLIQGVTNIARPKLWFFIFSAILIYQIGVTKSRITVLFSLVMLLFIWMWDLWEQGHWRGDMRREFMEKIKKKAKQNNEKGDDEDDE